ncbi:MAG: sulfur carrier protein ThiS [Gammaproteobacteria bacterium]|nr:sulfur carrier protein ThiS [Gammaproteobacteria bacterium]
MRIILNGESTDIINVNTVDDLIRELNLKGRLAVEVNQQIVPRSLFHSQKISTGDRIEIVHAIGGG